MSANKRRSNRARGKKRKKSGVELQDARPEQKTSGQKVEDSVELENNKEAKIESELKSSEVEIAAPTQFERPEQQLVEHVQAEPAAPSKQTETEPKAGQKSGGKRVADNTESIAESFTKFSESVFSLEGVKKAAAWYIETSEKLANQALELQEKATDWAKDTPFAPLFEAQNSFARKFVERSANAARTLWQIQPSQ
ncbi:MAG: hypothetical protein JO189_11590 [Deltaproteobacteria bacterium]|nr:hypothetical protein [Deltaproteobacteria bacterium]